MSKTTKIIGVIVLLAAAAVLYFRSADGKAVLEKTQDEDLLISSSEEGTQASEETETVAEEAVVKKEEEGFSETEKEELKQLISDCLAENLNAMLEDGRLPAAIGKYTEVTSGLVNINTADEEELTKLNGIGPAKAKAIVEYRKEKGHFESVDDLTGVSGISTGTVEKLRDQVTL